MIDKSGVVVVTGAGKGLGVALAKQLWQSGFSLALISRTEEDLVRLRDAVLSSVAVDQSLSIHVGDLSARGVAEAVFTEISNIHRKNIVGLVNNAATWTGGKGVVELSEDDLIQGMDKNFYSAFRCTKELLNRWLEKKYPACIVNVGATASLRGAKKSFAFAMAKSSLRVLSQSMAKELGPMGVHVVHLVVDGLLDNERTRRLNPQASDDRFIRLEPLAREVVNVMQQDGSCWTFELDIRTSTCDW